MLIHAPSYSIKSLINFLDRSGVPRAALLNLIATNDDTLNNTKHDYPFDDYERLLAYGADQLKVDNIGFEHGKAFELSCWGILGHIVIAAKNLNEALAYQRKYQCLLGNSGHAYYELTASVVILRWLSSHQCSANSIEQVITSWTAFAFGVVLTNDKPISVHFTHQCLGDEHIYRDFFGCEVYFNANFNGIIINKSSLHSTLATYNGEVLNVLCCHAENLLAAKRFSASIDIVMQYIIETLPNHVANLHEIAQHLGISVRQLQRKLQKEHTNLTTLIEEIRNNLAISYLTQTDHKLLYISTMLGYSEQSAFQRAFKRWHNIPPQEFRLNPQLLS